MKDKHIAELEGKVVAVCIVCPHAKKWMAGHFECKVARRHCHSNRVRRWLDEIIDYRYIREEKTVFSTNLAPAKLQDRIASRLQEGIVVVLECGDYRLTKAKMRKGKDEDRS